MGEGGTVRCGRRRRGIFRALLLAAALLGLGAGVLPAASAPPSAAGAAGQPAGPDWASLGLVAPLWVARSTPIVGQSFASVAGRIAYCAPGGIPLSRDGGATWTIISTAPVLQAAATSGYPLLTTGDVPPACTALALDPTYPDSLYAVFPSARGPYGAPPIIFVGYHTADGGQGWQPIPTPPGIDREQFGGFQVDGTAVQALFARPASTAGTPPGFLLEQTADGGQSWASPPLVDCPATGPCVRWGPAPNAIGSCAMHARIQPVEVSSDGGQSWSPAGFGGEAVETGLGGVNACALNELAALAEREVLLLTGDALAAGGSPAEPVRLSHDGGQSWQGIALPPLPGGAMPLLRGFQLLPGGALVARPQDGPAWLLLRPGASAWCAVPAAALDAPVEAADTARVIGDRFWWLEHASAVVPPTNQMPVPRSVPLAALQCGDSG